MEGASETYGKALNTALQSSIKPDSIATQFIDVLPWVGGLVIVCFVLYEARKLIKGAAKGKVRV